MTPCRANHTLREASTVYGTIHACARTHATVPSMCTAPHTHSRTARIRHHSHPSPTSPYLGTKFTCGSHGVMHDHDAALSSHELESLSAITYRTLTFAKFTYMYRFRPRARGCSCQALGHGFCLQALVAGASGVALSWRKACIGRRWRRPKRRRTRRSRVRGIW